MTFFVRRLSDPSAPHCDRGLAFGPDSTWLVALGDRAICFWDIRSGRLRFPPVVTESRVISIAVDPKGRWLFSTHDDNLLRRWVLSPGLIRKPYCDQAVELLPDGEWVVWADPDDETKDPRWVNYSPGAKRWLGYHAPSADGTRWEHQPLDADCTDPAAAGRSG